MECYLCGKEATTCNPWGDFICNECQENIINEDRRIANLDNRARCIELRESLNNLIMIIEREEKDQLPRFHSYLNIMRRNLDICIKSNFQELDELIPLLKEDWVSCWQVYTGLDDWYIYRKNYEERLKVNKILRHEENKIEKLIKFKERL